MSQLFDWNVKDSETQRTVDQDNKRISKRNLEDEKASVEPKKRRTLVESTSNRETEAAIVAYLCFICASPGSYGS
jgi:hypothetical protein